MKRIIAGLVVAGATSFAAQAAMAQSADQPDTEGGRYMLREVDGEYLRVDRQSGDTSVCRSAGSGWTCSLVADDRRAYEEEINRLTEENGELARQVADLRQQVSALRESAPGGRAEDGLADPPASPPATPPSEPDARGDTRDNEIILPLPSDEDLDKLSETFESVMRRFVEMLRSLRQDLDEKNAN